jgi:hypothetical protein
LNPEPGAPFRLMASSDARNWASVSPNGRWLLYRAFDRGRSGIYVTRFPPGNQSWTVSANNSRGAEWSREGSEIHFDSQGSLMAVDFRETAAGPSIGTPHALFTLPILRQDGRDWYASTRDGSRFYIVTTEPGSEPPMDVVVNWPRLLDGK